MPDIPRSYLIAGTVGGALGGGIAYATRMSAVWAVACIVLYIVASVDAVAVVRDDHSGWWP